MRATALVVLALASLPVALRAEPSDTAPLAKPPEKPAPTVEDRSHRHQFGLAVTVGSGYRVLFKYADAATCGDAGKTTCYGRVPTWLDAKIFFGVSKAIDIVVEQRFGLEADFSNNHQLLLMPGIRIYPDGALPFKFYVQIQLVLDYSDPGATSPNRYDFGFHEANGFQWDFLKWGGAYLQVSETFGFVRSFNFQLEAGAGVEGRFP